jgi:hypothetical protein
MICHEDIGVHRTLVFFARRSQQGQVQFMVLPSKKTSLAIIAALRYVLRNAGQV